MRAFSGWFVVLGVALTLGILSDSSLDLYYQGILFAILVNVMLASSLNLVNGFCGQFSLGQAGFMAIGAYVSGMLSLRLAPIPAPFDILNFPIYAICGGVTAAAAGWVVGMPSLRLRGDYLAIVTLGFGEIVRVMLMNWDAAGGSRGLIGIPGATDFGATMHAALWAGGTVLLLRRLIDSSYGRGFLSVREDEIASECMGINVTRTKVMAFVISSFFAGAAGSLFAHFNNFLNPATFSFVKSVDVVIMVVLGGMGSLTGSLVGAVLVTILPEALRPLQKLLGVDLRMVIYSLILILLMILRPQGLFGGADPFKFFRRRRVA